ncbi:hypothetical protein [Fluviicola sp.]|uniref:hypothetical protein n=1 Tax=Fluviicola sp. TaxID=1917219 RepID=UPI002618C267|nr:hypothetical protein [Fluviicola sp.]
MKNTLKSFSFALGFVAVLMACDENKINVSEGRLELPEPDKAMRIDYQIRESLALISKEITNSDDIESCNNGKKLINSGTEILPYLANTFSDSTKTPVFSKINNRTLTIGEIAIIIASEIKPIPIARVVGIQQCTPPFQQDIEHYFWKIKLNPSGFMKEYTIWIWE